MYNKAARRIGQALLTLSLLALCLCATQKGFAAEYLWYSSGNGFTGGDPITHPYSIFKPDANGNYWIDDSQLSYGAGLYYVTSYNSESTIGEYPSFTSIYNSYVASQPKLQLIGMTSHNLLHVQFTLYALGHIQGNGTASNAYSQVWIDHSLPSDRTSLHDLDYTFSNGTYSTAEGLYQSYPDTTADTQGGTFGLNPVHYLNPAQTGHTAVFNSGGDSEYTLDAYIPDPDDQSNMVLTFDNTSYNSVDNGPNADGGFEMTDFKVWIDTVNSTRLTSMSPNNIDAGSSSFTLTLNGNNLSGAATTLVEFGVGGSITQLTPTSISASTITVTIPSTLVSSTQAGVYYVDVVQDGVRTNRLRFWVPTTKITCSVTGTSHDANYIYVTLHYTNTGNQTASKVAAAQVTVGTLTPVTETSVGQLGPNMDLSAGSSANQTIAVPYTTLPTGSVPITIISRFVGVHGTRTDTQSVVIN